MPNGHDKNWVRLCAAIDGFRARHGHWPTRVRAYPIIIEDLHALFTAEDFAQITRRVELVEDDDAPVIAEDDNGNKFNYGTEGFSVARVDTPARELFGVAPIPEEWS